MEILKHLHKGLTGFRQSRRPQFCNDPTISLQRTIYIPSFKYEMCNKKVYDGRHSFWFRDLDIMTTAYGDVDFTGSFVTTHNMTSPLKATLNLKRSVLGVNIKIPCIKNFGSCTYSDICVFGYRDEESCPPILDENDVPCRCPIEPLDTRLSMLERACIATGRFSSVQGTVRCLAWKKHEHNQGVYNIPGIQLKEMARSRWASLLAGKYKVMIKLYQGDKILTCYNIYFTLA